MTKKFELRKGASIPSEDGFSLVHRAVGLHGQLLFLFIEEPGAQSVNETYERGIGVFPKHKMEQRHLFRLVTIPQNAASYFSDFYLDTSFPLLDVFSDGAVCVASSRCQWRSENDFDLNGVVISPDGQTVKRHLFGDGIESIAIDANDRIWISYFDEGVFGNFGWGNPGPQPVGASGLNCFDRDGQLVWEYPASGSGDEICDCYAMNVSPYGAFVFSYPGFSICRIDKKFEQNFWETSLSGCHSFAISGDRVLFSGQYDDTLSTGYLGVLDQTRLTNLEEIEFVLSDNSALETGELIARGSRVYYFSDKACYWADVEAS